MIPVPAARAPRVLVAEDDAAAASVLQAILARDGYQVVVAPDGATAARLLEEGPAPDVLVLDWMLPDISGPEICCRVRERWDALSLPILMVTAKADPESVAAAFEAGASDYLTKPFLGAELRARVAAHLRIKQLVEERSRMEEHLAEREKLSALGLLVSGVAHDLNNPLGGIFGHVQLLLEEETDPAKQLALQRILAEAQRCNRIVGDLLSFARRRPAERIEVHVGEVLRSTMDLRERHLHRAGIHARVQVDPAVPRIRADPHQLQQVFLNLLINAEQALRHGGRNLHATVELASPDGARRAADDWVSVAFYNDGPPIPPEALPHIFEPFFTTKEKEEGTGLGLSICRRIVRAHGGEVEVESGAGGTTFRVLLPVAEGG